MRNPYSRPIVYLAARYSRRAELQAYADQLEQLNVASVPARWLRTEHDWDGTTSPVSLGKAQQYALEDAQDLTSAHAVVVFTEQPARVREAALAELEDYVPGHTDHLAAAARIEAHAGGYRRGGSLVELGLALGLGKQVFVVGPAANVFCTMPVVWRVASWTEALAAVISWKSQLEAHATRQRLVLP